MVTPALSKTCSILGRTTPAVAVSSVAGRHQDNRVKRTAGLRSPLSPPSHSHSRELNTSAGVFLAMKGRSCSWAVSTLPLPPRSSLAPPALPALICHIEQGKGLYLYVVIITNMTLQLCLWYRAWGKLRCDWWMGRECTRAGSGNCGQL